MWMDELGGGRDNGTKIQIWDNPDSQDSQFLIKSIGNNAYTIRNIGNGLFVNAKGNGKANSTKVHVWNNPGNTSTQWIIKLYSAIHGIYTIENVNAPGEYLNCKGNHKNNGTPVHLYNNPEQASTQWKLHSLSQ